MFRFSVQNMHPEIRDAHPKHQNLPAPPASHPKGQMDCTQERMSCVAASAPLETSHATVFLLLQLFGCLNYVCLTRLFFPSCAQISRHTLFLTVYVMCLCIRQTYMRRIALDVVISNA